MLRDLIAIIIAYLLGSIPFGYLIVLFTKGSDIRKTGSGGTGATNVSRRAGKLAGVVTLLLDAAKGATAILIARWLLDVPSFETNLPVALSGIAVMVGHVFPIWLRFRGGKGVATGVGVFLTMTPLIVLFASTVFFIVVLLTRYVSLGSITAAITIPIFVPLFYQSSALLVASITGAALIVFAHRANISRLLSGTENKFR